MTPNIIGARIAQITAYGGPDVIQWIDADLPAPAPGEVTIRHHVLKAVYADKNSRIV
jgi:NADPH:quinone reductase